MGMSDGYYLAKSGWNTLMIDAFDPPHENGSHRGDTRLIRHACGEGLSYVTIALRAQELWNEHQKQTTERIFLNTGVITLGPSDSIYVRHVITVPRQYNIYT